MKVFHHVLLKYGLEKVEIEKRKFDDITLRYSNNNFYSHKQTLLFINGYRRMEYTLSEGFIRLKGPASAAAVRRQRFASRSSRSSVFGYGYLYGMLQYAHQQYVTGIGYR